LKTRSGTIKGWVQPPATGHGRSYLIVGLLLTYIVSMLLLSKLAVGAGISKAIGLGLAYIFIAHVLVRDERIWLPTPLRWMLAFIAVSLTGGFFAPDKVGFLGGTLTLVQLFGFGLILVNLAGDPRVLRLTERTVVFTLLVAVILAAVGFDFSPSARLGGVFVNANAYALALFFGCALCIKEVVSATSLTKRLLWAAPLLPFLYHIFLTGSRKGLLAVPIFLVLFLMLGIGRFHNRRVAWSVALIGALLAVLVLRFEPTALKRMAAVADVFTSGDINMVQEKSLRFRCGFAAAAIAIWKDYPVFGAGTDQFRNLVLEKDPSLQSTYSHNNYVELLANNGLVGFILWYGAYVSLLCRLWFRSKVCADRQRSMQMVAYCALLVTVMVLEVAWVTYSDKLFWLMFTMGIASTRTGSGVRPGKDPLVREASVNRGGGG